MIGRGWRGRGEKPEGHRGGGREVAALLLAFALIAPPILAAWLVKMAVVVAMCAPFLVRIWLYQWTRERQ